MTKGPDVEDKIGQILLFLFVYIYENVIERKCQKRKFAEKIDWPYLFSW